MSDEPETYGEWLRQMKDLKGGWLGTLIIVVTLVICAVGAVYGLAVFPDGNYPRFILALPGLAIGAGAFFVRPRKQRQFRSAGPRSADAR